MQKLWQWRIYIVKFWTRAPPGGPNSFNFMQFLGKFGKIVCWRPPPGELAPPPRGNPGSATVWVCLCLGQSQGVYLFWILTWLDSVNHCSYCTTLHKTQNTCIVRHIATRIKNTLKSHWQWRFRYPCICFQWLFRNHHCNHCNCIRWFN